MKLYEYLARMLDVGVNDPKHLKKLTTDSKFGKKFVSVLNDNYYSFESISCLECCQRATKGYCVLVEVRKLKTKFTLYFSVCADIKNIITVTIHGSDDMKLVKPFTKFLLETSVTGNMYNKLINMEK